MNFKQYNTRVNAISRKNSTDLIVRFKYQALIACTAIAAVTGCASAATATFDPSMSPPAPDYGQSQAWLALPERPGLEQSRPQGVTPVQIELAAADVFFIHPTTYKGRAIANVPYDTTDHTAPLTSPVLIGQASVFNGCCRIYAPRYRQASLASINDDQAMALAYSDVARAFRYFIEHKNHGRPFIIASHSQGTGHAVRLMQEEIYNHR